MAYWSGKKPAEGGAASLNRTPQLTSDCTCAVAALARPLRLYPPSSSETTRPSADSSAIGLVPKLQLGNALGLGSSSFPPREAGASPTRAFPCWSMGTRAGVQPHRRRRCTRVNRGHPPITFHEALETPTDPTSSSANICAICGEPCLSSSTSPSPTRARLPE